MLQETVTVLELRGFFLSQGWLCEVTAAAHLWEELDADWRLVRAGCPGALPCPGGGSSGQPVVQISILTSPEAIVITVVVGGPIEEGGHPIVVVHLLQVVKAAGLTGSVVLPDKGEHKPTLHVPERIA